MYYKLIKAINEGLDKALMSFDDEEKFDKESKLKNKIVIDMFFQEYMNPLSRESYEKILKLYNKDGIQFPVETKTELKDLINLCIRIIGLDCNLNWIDVSNITNMDEMIAYSSFNGDISKWDVSNVETMRYMFYSSTFNGDISKWDVSNVVDMHQIFRFSNFNGNISKLDVSHVTDMSGMFNNSIFNGNISEWDVSNVTNMSYMFYLSKFNKDISKWDISLVQYISNMFDNCPIFEKYKPNFHLLKPHIKL